MKLPRCLLPLLLLLLQAGSVSSSVGENRQPKSLRGPQSEAAESPASRTPSHPLQRQGSLSLIDSRVQQQVQDQDDDYPRRRLEDRPSGGLNIPINTNQQTPGGIPENTNQQNPANSNSNSNTESQNTAADFPSLGLTLDGREWVYCLMEFGFEPGFARDVTVEEIEELQCHINTYIADRVRMSLEAQNDNRPIRVKSRLINWEFTHQGDELPLTLTFFADTSYRDGEKENVNVDTVFYAFDLSPEEIANFIQNYMWMVNINNPFYYSTTVTLTVRQAEPLPRPQDLKIDQTFCDGETRFPSFTPSMMPSLQPTSLQPTKGATEAPTVGTLSPTVGDAVVPTAGTLGPTPTAGGTTAPTAGGTVAPTSASNNGPTANDAPTNNNPTSTSAPTTSASNNNNNPTATGSDNGGSPTTNANNPTVLSPSSPNAGGGTSMPSPATTATMSPTVTMNPTGTMSPTSQSSDGTTSPTTIDAANTGVPTSGSGPTTPTTATQGPAGPPAASPTTAGGGALDGGVTEAPAASPTATTNDQGPTSTGTTTNSPTAAAGDTPTATPLGGQQPSDATSPTATQAPTVGGGGTSAPTAGTGDSSTTTAPSSPTDTPPGNLPVSGSSTNTGGDGTNEPSNLPSSTPTFEPTLAPTANPLVPVSYRMDFTWAEQSFQPKTAQIQQMLCETELFLQERLAVATTMPHVNARLSNIDWDHEALPEGGAVLAVNWTLTTTLEDDSSDNPLVHQKIVLAALQPDSKTNTSLYDYLLQTATADDESGSTGRRRIRRLRIRALAQSDEQDEDVHEEVALENRNGNIFGSAVGIDNRQGGATGSVGSPFGYMSSLTLTDYPLDTELASPGQLESLVGVCNELSVRDPPESALGEPLPAELLDELNGGNGVNKPGGDNDRETGDGSPGSTPGGGSSPLAPTVAPGPSVRTVNVSFVVSNLDSITVPQEVNNSGLSVSFPAFAEQVVRRVKTEDGRRRYLRASTQERQLETTTIDLEPGTAYVSQLIRTNCGDNVDEKLICHEAMAQFNLRREVTADGSTNQQQRRRLQDWTHRYAVETYQGINDGTYYDIMKEKMPGTPLYIGTMVPGAPESSGVSYVVFWILIVLIILLVLCVILTCAYLCYERNQHDKELDDLYDELDKMEDWEEENDKNAKPQHHHHHYPPEKANKDGTGKGSDSDKRSTEEEEDDFLDEEEFMDISEISGKDGDDMGGFVDADDFDMFEDEAREVEQMEDAASDQSPIDAAKEGRALPMDGDDEAATRGIDQANNKEPPPDEIDSDEENVIHVGPQEFDASSLSEISARELEQSGSFSGSHSGSSSGSSGSSSGGSASCDVSVSSGSYDEDEDVDRHLEDSPKTRISVDSDHGGPVVFEDLDDTTEGDDDDLEASVTLQEIFNLSKPLGESGGDMSEKQARALPPTIEEQQEDDDQSAPSTPQRDGVQDAEEPPDPLDDLFSSSDSDDGTEGSYDDHADVLPTHESESNNSERSANSIGDGEPATRALNERASQDSDEESLGEEYGHGAEREPTNEDEAYQSAHSVPSTAGSEEDKEPATRALPLNESDENSLENDHDDEGETTNEEDQAARALAAAAAGTAAAVAVGAAVASRDSDEDSVEDEEDQVIVADLRALPVASDADDEQLQSIEPTTRSAGDNQSDDDSTEAEEDHVVVADLRELPIASDSDADDEHIQSASSVPSNPAEEDEAAARSLGDSSDDDSQEDLSGDRVLPNPSDPDVAGDEQIQSSRSIPTDTAGEDETAAARSLGDSSDDDSQEDLSGDRVLRNPARPDVADDEQIQSSRSIPTNTAEEDETAATRSFGDISGCDSEEEPSPGDDNDHMSQSDEDEDEDDTSYPNVPPDADEVDTTGDDDSLGDEEDHTARNLAVAAAGTAAALAVGAAVASRDRDSDDDDSLGDEEPVNGKEDSNNESDQEHTSRSIPAAAEKAPIDLNSTGSNDSDEDALETEEHPDDRLGATSSDDDDESSPNTPPEAGTRAISDHDSEEEDEDEEPSNDKVDAADRVEKEDYGPALQHLMSALGGNAQEDSDEDSLEAQESLSMPPVAASRATSGPDSKEEEDRTDDDVDPAYDDDDQEDHQTARSAPLSSNDDGNDRDDDDYQAARNGPLSSSALGDIALDDSDEDSLEGQLFGEVQSTNRDDAQDRAKETEDDEPKEKDNSGDDSSSSSGDGSEDEGSIMSSSGWSSSGSHSSSDEEVEDEQQRQNEGASRSRGSTGSHSSNEGEAEDRLPQDGNAGARSIGNDSDGSLEDIIGESTEELQMEQENNTLALEHAQNSANLATMESSFSEIEFHERGGADKEDKMGQPDQDNDAMSTTSSLHESTGSMDGHIFEDNGSYDFENSVSLTDLFGLTKPSGEEKQAMSTIEEASVEDDQSARSTRSTRTLDDVANGVGEEEQQNGGKTRGLSMGSDEGKPVVFEDDRHTSAELERSMALQEVFNLTREEQRAHDKPPVVEQDTSPEESVSLDDVFGIPGGSGRGEKQAVSIPPPIEEASEEEERSVAGENVKSAADASGEVDFNEMTELDDSDEDEVPEWAKIDDDGEFFEESFEKESSDSDSSSSSSGSGDEEFEDFNGSGDDEEFEDFEDGSGGATHIGSNGLNGSGDSAKLKNSQGSNDSGELWEDFDGSGDNPEEKDWDRGDPEASPGSVEMKNSGDGSAEDWEDFEDGSGGHEEDEDSSSSSSSSDDSENGGEASEEHQESGGSAAMNESEEWEEHDESNGDSSKQNKSTGSFGDSGVDWEEYDTNQDPAVKDKSSGSLSSSGVDWEDYDEGGTHSKQNKSSGSLGDSGVDWEDYNASGDVAKQNKSSGSLGGSGVDWEDYSDDVVKQNKSSGSLGDSGVDWEDYDEDGTNAKQNKSSGSLGSSGVDWEDYDEGGTTTKQNNSSRSLGDSGVDWEDYDEGGDAAIKDKSSGSLGNSGVDWEDYDGSSGDVAKDNKSSGSLGSSGVEWEDFDEGGGGGGNATTNKKNDMNGSGQWSGYNDAVQGLGRLSPHGGQVSEHIEFDYDSDDASDEEAKDDDSDSVRDAYSVDSDNEKAKDSMWESYYNDSNEIVYDDDDQEEDW